MEEKRSFFSVLYKNEIVLICKKIYMMDEKYFTQSEKYGIILTFIFCYLSYILRKITVFTLNTVIGYLGEENADTSLLYGQLNGYGVVVCKLFILITEKTDIEEIYNFSENTECDLEILESSDLSKLDDNCLYSLIKHEYNTILQNYIPTTEKGIQLTAFLRLFVDLTYMSFFLTFAKYIFGIIDAIIPF